MLALTVVLLALTLSSCGLDGGLDTVEELYVQDFESYKVNLGKAVNLENIKLTAIRRSGAIEKNIQVTPDMISDYSRENEGVVEIYITYEGVKTKFLVEYVKPVIAEIEVLSVPVPFVAVEGQEDELNLTGLKLRVRYEDDSEFATVEGLREANIEGYNNRLEPGTHTIYVTYYNKKIPLEINILSKSIERISVAPNQMQNKKDYIVGDTYDPSGLELFVEYNNKTSEVIRYDDLPEGFSFSYTSIVSEDTFFKKADANYPVIVKYKGKSYKIYCRVFNARIVNVEMVDFQAIKSQPVNLNGENDVIYPFSASIPEGVRIDASTGQIRVTYDDGNEELVSLDSHLVSLYVSLDQNEATNVAIDKATYRFKQSDEKLYVRYRNSTQILEFDIHVVAKLPVELNIVGLSVDDGLGGTINVLDKKYYNGQRFDDSLLRYNVLYNNGLYKHPNVQGVPIEEQHANWTRVGEGLSVESSLLLQIDLGLPEGEATVKNIAYSIGEISATVSVNVYPRLVIDNTIYIKEPEKTYQTVSEIEASPDGKPVVSGGYVSFLVEGGFADLNRAYLNPSMITYYDASSLPVTEFEVGTYTAQAEITHSSIDFPFLVEYQFVVGAGKITEVQIGEIVESEFVPIDASTQLTFNSIGLFDLSNYYARRKIEGEPDFEAAEQLSAQHLYQTRAKSLGLNEQAPVLRSGDIELSIRYYGVIKQLHLHFKSQDIKGIEIMQMPKTYYALNDAFSIEGLVVSRINSEGGISIVKGTTSFQDQSMWRFEGYNPTQLGEQTITVTYQPTLPTKRVTTYKIFVGNKVVSSIEFDEELLDNSRLLLDYSGEKVIPVKHKSILNTRYVVQEMNPDTGLMEDVLKTLKLKVNYSDTTFEYIELKSQYFDVEAWFDVSFALGETNLLRVAKIFYGGKETTAKILVSKAITLESMSIFRDPNNKAFIEGENVRLHGGLCELNYQFGGESYRLITDLTSSFIKAYGYNKNITIPSDKIMQTVYIGFINENEEIRAELGVYTYRKINPTFNVTGLIVDYGVLPIIEVKINMVEQFTLPNYSLEFLVDDTWTNNVPFTPGEYSVKVIVHQNAYYNDLVTSTHKLLIQRRKIIILLSDVGKQKAYRAADPVFKDCILSQDLPLEGDIISFDIGRVAGEAVGEYLLLIDTFSGAENDNSYYDFVIAPSTFKIKPKEVNTENIEIMWSTDNRSFNIRDGATQVTRSEYKLYDLSDTEILNLNDVDSGSYYVKFGSNYVLYELNANDEKVIIESKRFYFTLE